MAVVERRHVEPSGRVAFSVGTERYIYRCAVCKHVRTTTYTTYSVEHRRRVAIGPGHSWRVLRWVRYKRFALGDVPVRLVNERLCIRCGADTIAVRVVRSHHPAKCDWRCYLGWNGTCACSCEGWNHGLAIYDEAETLKLEAASRGHAVITAIPS